MIARERIVAKLARLTAKLGEVVELLAAAIEEKAPVHEVERGLLGWLTSLGREALQLLLEDLGTGDMGPTCELPDGRVLKRSKELHKRNYQSVFGAFELQRFVYAARERQQAEFVPLDARLALPNSKFSYLLQDFDQHAAMEQPFEQVSKTIQRILGVEQHVDSLERMNRKLAEHVEDFHAQQTPPPAAEEGAVVVQTADGKGVPIRHPADTPPIYDHQHRTGPKPDRKKMATVAAVYTVDRFVRTPEEVVESLFRQPGNRDSEPPPAKRPRPCHKRVRACLNHVNPDGDEIEGRPAMFGWIADEVLARNPEGKKPVVSIMDGQESLWAEAELFQGDRIRHQVQILDLLHVTPRLWQVAHVFCPGKGGARRVEKFVRQRVLDILHGRVGSVIRGLRRMATLQQLDRSARKKVETICHYFHKNRDRMRYHEYLKAGYPIASGVIEGACRNVVKDRMERTGMNWVVPGAQAMLDLRCIYLSGQWDEYISFYITRETKRLHPHRNLIDTIPCFVAA